MTFRQFIDFADFLTYLSLRGIQAAILTIAVLGIVAEIQHFFA